ncbi:MAG: polyribonucleotide nucleotidyltransferase [Candidatus Glassbacteria bacterium]
MVSSVEMAIGGATLSIESGRVAKQADGAVIIKYGETVLLVTVVASKEPDFTRGFFPLFVDYREKFYASGKIPGGFFKREGRPSEKEVLNARLVDRPIRPFFPKGYLHEVQLMVMVLSYDQENDPDILGIIGASAALGISGIPFDERIGAVKVGRIGGKFIINPASSQLEESDIDITVAGTDSSIVMVEGGANELPEIELLEAFKLAHEEIRKIISLQKELVEKCGKPRKEYNVLEIDDGLKAELQSTAPKKVIEALAIPEKEQRVEALKHLRDEFITKYSEDYPDSEIAISWILEDIEKREMRKMILEEGKRLDGRGLDEIREIKCDIGYLPRTHGSALFTRGQTQALVVVTLGTSSDEQMIDDLEGISHKSYMLHYNFPPFSVGEVGMIRGPGRREIGHGNLAERALKSVIPDEMEFPYTVRIVSDILESNGSSSMATVCGGSLSLMDAGVPVKDSIAGIAMGLVKDGEQYRILTDILGIEDHLGDMDFKVAGTKKGVTAIQMDMKTQGIDFHILEEALAKAKEARIHILDVMNSCISKPRPNLSPYAPRIITITVDRDKIRDVIGPGGKIIRKIIEETGAKVDIEDDGVITIASVDQHAGELALERIKEIAVGPEVGKTYWSTVKSITNFGAFVEFLPGKEGLVHISELAEGRVRRVEDLVRVGDRIRVKLIGIDNLGRVKLSRKAALMEEKQENSKPREDHDNRRPKRNQKR